MYDYSVTTPDIETRRQYEELPDHVKSELSSHFEAIHSAKSLRKLAYPAHRNRGVTIRYEDPALKVSLHVARDADRNIQILGLLSTIRDVVGMQDYRAVHTTRCPECGQAPGQPCRLPVGDLTDRPHLSRRKATENLLEESARPPKDATTWSLTGPEIVEILTGVRPVPAGWDESFASYRALKGADGDPVLRASAAFVAARNPKRMWNPVAFRLFVEESVSGPYTSPLQAGAFWIRRDRGLRRLTEVQARSCLTGNGPALYAQKLGAVFLPLEGGRVVAVENPKVVDSK